MQQQPQPHGHQQATPTTAPSGKTQQDSVSQQQQPQQQQPPQQPQQPMSGQIASANAPNQAQTPTAGQDQSNTSAVMQNQMFQLISQMAQAQDVTQSSQQQQVTAQAAQAPAQTSEYQGPAPQIQGGAAMTMIQQAAAQKQAQSAQNHEGQAVQTNPVVEMQQSIQGQPLSQSQVLQQQPNICQPHPTTEQTPNAGVQTATQPSSQQMQQQPAPAAPGQTMESLINALNQFTQQQNNPAAQPQQPQAHQPVVAQQLPQQQVLQQNQQQQPLAQYSTAGNLMQPQQQQVTQQLQQLGQETTAVDGQNAGNPNQQMQIVDILSQITKSLNTIKQATQNNQPQQQPYQTYQQPQQVQQLPQQQVPQLAHQQAFQVQPQQLQQQPMAQPQVLPQQVQPQGGQGNNLNSLVLQLLSSAVTGAQIPAQIPATVPQQQPATSQEGYSTNNAQMSGGGLPPPQPYQHEAMHQLGTTPAGTNQFAVADGGFNNNSAEAQPHQASNMTSLLQQIVNSQSNGGQAPPHQQQPAAGQIVNAPNQVPAQAPPSTGNNVSQANDNETQGEPQFIKFFVGGVLYSAKEADVENYFKRFGEVVDVAIMRDKMTGRSRGFAFVTFKERSIESVQTLRQTIFDPQVSHVIQDRKIEVRESDGIKPADSFLGKTSQHSNLQQMTSGSSERRGNDRGGNRRDRNSSPRGSGQQRGSGSGNADQQRGKDSNQGRNRQEGGRRKRSRSRDRSRSAAVGGGTKQQEDTLMQGIRDKVFVGGLEYNLTDQDFLSHFEQFGSVKDGQIVRDPVSGQSRGFGFVTFKDASVAQKLINETGHTKLAGRKVDLRKAELKTCDKIAILNKSGNGEGNNRNSNNGSHANNNNQGSSNNNNKDGGPSGHHHPWHNKKGQNNNSKGGSNSGSGQNDKDRRGQSQSSGNNCNPGNDGNSNNNSAPGNKNSNSQGGVGGSGNQNRQSSNNRGGNMRHGQNQPSGGRQGGGQSQQSSGAQKHGNNSDSAGHGGNNNNRGRGAGSDKDRNNSNSQNNNRSSSSQPGRNQGGHHSGSYSTAGGFSAPDNFAGGNAHGHGVMGPYTAFERQHNMAAANSNDSGAPSSGYRPDHHMGSSGLPMTQSITQLFSKPGDGNGRSGDDGGYAKPSVSSLGDGSQMQYGASSHVDGFSGDLAKVDFDKPLFDVKSSKDGAGDHRHSGNEYGGQRSLYSSSSASKQQIVGQVNPHATSAKKDSSIGQAIRTDMPLASEMAKQNQRKPNSDFTTK